MSTHAKLPGEEVKVDTAWGPIWGKLVEIRSDQRITLENDRTTIRILGGHINRIGLVDR